MNCSSSCHLGLKVSLFCIFKAYCFPSWNNSICLCSHLWRCCVIVPGCVWLGKPLRTLRFRAVFRWYNSACYRSNLGPAYPLHQKMKYAPASRVVGLGLGFRVSITTHTTHSNRVAYLQRIIVWYRRRTRITRRTRQ